MNSSTKETSSTQTSLRPVFTVVNVILSCALVVSIFLMVALVFGTGATSKSLTAANWSLAAGFTMGVSALIGFLSAIFLRLDRLDDKIDNNRREASRNVKDLHSRLEKKIDDNHNQLRSEINEKHNQLRDEMNEKHNQLRSEMNEKHNQLRTQIQGLQTTLLSHEGPVEKPKRRA